MEKQRAYSGDGGSGHPARREDRRRNHVKAFFVQFVKPSRRRGRRQTDTHGFQTDYHGPIVLLLALTVMSLCIVDVFATLTLLQIGSTELNPIMRELIESDVKLFFAVKYISNAVGVFLLLSYKGFQLFNKHINSLQALCVFIVVYLVLVTYQLTMLYIVAN